MGFLTVIKFATWWAAAVGLVFWTIDQKNNLGVFGAPLISGIAIYMVGGATIRAVKSWWWQRRASQA